MGPYTLYLDEGLHSVDVQVIARLIQEQDVRPLVCHLRESHTALLPPREDEHGLHAQLPADAEAAQVRPAQGTGLGGAITGGQ